MLADGNHISVNITIKTDHGTASRLLRRPRRATATGSAICFLKALNRAEYPDERTADSSQQKLQRLVRRLGIPQADVETWLGTMRQILWKGKRPEI
jgi:hypothetical protein